MRGLKLTAILVVVLGASSAVASADYAPTIPVPGSLSPDAVAVVESTPVTKQAFDHAYDVYVKFSGKLSTKEQTTARAAVLTSLVDGVRARIEATALGIVISDAVVKDRFEVLKEQSFPKEIDYKRFLKRYGQTEADLIELVRTSMYKEKLLARWLKGATVSDQELLDEYKAHPRRYDRAASRDLLLIFNSKRKTIYKALAALKRGQSFKRVAARFSSDSGSGKNGGRFPGVEKGQFPRKLDRAVFKAKRGKLIGPIKTQYGYYLVRVTRINKRRARTFEEAREDIHEYLLDQKQTAIAETAQKSFESRWKPATLCRTGYVAKVCGAYSN